MEVELPYKCEYAKSGRAGCKFCKTNIPQGTIRIAAMVQSPFHDGRMANWFHEDCFFKKQRPQSEGDITSFENLKYEDQQRIKRKISEFGSVVVSVSGKGKKRSKADNAALKDFGIEYAKSGRAACRGCEQKIAKDEIRIKKVSFDTEVGMKYGGQPLWHHTECFAQVRNDLGWFAKGEDLPGFKSLSKEDQGKIKSLLPAIKMEDVPDAKKMKTEVKDEADVAAEKELEKKVATQLKLLFKYRDNAENEMTKPDMRELLQENDQVSPEGDSKKLLDQLADMLAFGALKRCDKCKDGQFVFNKSGYVCTGNLDEWTKCANLVKEPSRFACKINANLREKYTFLKKYKSTVTTRAVKYVPPSAKALEMAGVLKKEEELEGPKVKREKPPLYNLEFVILGLKKSEKELTKTINSLGGRVVRKIHENLAAIISTPELVKEMGTKMNEAKNFGIQIVPEDYIEIVKEQKSGAISYITSKSICDWGVDPTTRIPKEEETKSKSQKSIYTKSVPKSVSLKIKDGNAVDPDSGLADVAHVYVNGKNRYSSVLGLTDIQRNKNSFYKIQLLKSDNSQRFWVFRSWGRIGTTIGGNKVDPANGLNNAIQLFESLFLEKTGNHWSARDNFVKVPGRMCPIDIDYGDDDKNLKFAENPSVVSKLPTPVQDLIKLMFDVDSMKKVMKEFDLDMEKMPLGKLSEKQIREAYKVLTEISELIKNGGTNSQFISCTNRFYTLIPHSFGVDNPPLLDTEDAIKHHSEMLDSLLELEFAYNILKVDTTNETNQVDQCYDKLQTEMIPIDKETDEYKLLEQYIQNTHAETHKMYELEIIDAFKVSRKGELRRFKPFKKLHNRKLLWHGSRLTNFPGILSHGLKIAPPEAPCTGYMFGKGIYFADMVSKSANYCFTDARSSNGLLLLSEVALGNMLECHSSKYVTKLPKDKHSTKGVGRTAPNPKESQLRPDGVEIPLGKPITDNNLQTSLLYNEYIVYDVAQVNIQYLIRMDFKYKY